MFIETNSQKEITDGKEMMVMKVDVIAVGMQNFYHKKNGGPSTVDCGLTKNYGLITADKKIHFKFFSRT